MITQRDILFAGLMGINAVGTIERSLLVQNELQKRVLPNIPFLPVLNESEIKTSNFSEKYDVYNGFNGGIGGTINQADAPLAEDQQFFPLSFAFTNGGQKWLFPFEPMINISSGNNIVKRNVAKQGKELVGTIKERWSRKDFDIQVTGALIGSKLRGNPSDCFPKAQMINLFEFLIHEKEIYIYCEPLEILGITKVVVEDYSFPFTKGENVQAFDLKLVSDFSYNLLIKE